MTGVVPAARVRHRRRRQAGEFVGTWSLVRFQLRRDRVKLPAWTGGIALMMLYIVTAIPAAYGVDEDLASAAQMFQQPVGRLLVGPGYGFDADPSLARFTAGGYGLYFLLLVAVMSILLVTRHTRVEEQTGRAELVRSTVVGRLAPLTATLVVAVVTNAVAGLLVLAIMVGVGGFAAGSSALFAVGIAVTGMAFAGITAVTVQLTEYSRAAAGMAGVVLGGSFVLRGVGDMARTGGNTLSWLSPLGWGQQTAPFVLDRWWPLALPLGLAVLSACAGVVLAGRRDLGAGMRTARPGRPRGSTLLATPLGLALRLQRGALLGWTVALAVTGAVFGAYADVLLTTAVDVPEMLLEVFGGAQHVLNGYLAYMTLFMAYVISMYVVLAVQSLRAEETGGRGEALLATPVSRRAWLGATLVVTAGGVVVMLLVTGVATGAAVAVVTGDADQVAAVTLAHLNQVPGVLVVLGLAALLFGALPRALRWAWAIIVYGLFVGTFGPVLDLPEASDALSPYAHAAPMPLEGFEPLPPLALLAVAVGLAVAGLVAFRRRDLDPS